MIKHFFTYLLIISLFVLTNAKTNISNLKITYNPIDTNSKDINNFIEYKNGSKLPISGKAGIYQIEFTTTNLDKIEDPTLYLGPVSYPLRVYINDELKYNWGYSLSSFRMQTFTANYIRLFSNDYSEPKTVKILFYTDEQKVAFPKFEINSFREINTKVSTQNIFNSIITSVFSILSFIFGVVIIIYYFITNKKYPLMLYISLFALSEFLAYSIFFLDSASIKELPLFKISRIAFPFAATFLFSATIRFIKSKSRTLKIIEKIFYVIPSIYAILVIISPIKSDIYNLFNIYSLSILSIQFPLILILILHHGIRNSIEHQLIFVGFSIAILSGSIDLYFLATHIEPYAWLSAYGQFINIVLILITIGIFDRRTHLQLVDLKDKLILSNKKIVKAKHNLELENLKKENFIKAVSHETKTPLNALIGITDELIDKSIPEYRYLQLSVNRLNLSISNIFTYSKLNKKEEVILSSVSVIDIIKDVADFHREEIRNKDISIILIDNPNIIPKKVYSNSSILGSIINNLISNAIKFTDKGGIAISLDYRETNFYLTISDTGCGIPKDKIDDIFTSFNTQDNFDNNYRINSIGLGLSIINHHIKTLNGSIDVKNKPNGGAEFSFVIPMQIATEERRDQVKYNILIAEDNHLNVLVLSKILDNLHYSYDIAENGLEALDKAIKNKYDIILMDIQMPKMDGLEATLEIRKANINTPIIALTANADREECINSGMNGYATKPYNSPTIKSIIESFARSPQE